MTLHVAVDFGTSSTCVAVSVDGREPQVVVVDGQPLVSSAVFAAQDGTLFVGQEAERQAAIDPSRYEPHPKRRIDEGELLLGDTVIEVIDVVRAVLDRAVTEARRFAGGAAVDLLVLTYPADWGAMRTRTLRQAANGLAQEIALVPEPVAAAVFHAASNGLSDGAALAVLDLGGGTVDVSVVRREPQGNAPDRGFAPRAVGGGMENAGFRVLATHGDPNFGGADIDQLLLEHVGRTIPEDVVDGWHALTQGRELADRRRRRALRQDLRGAKETLSRHAYTDVPLPHPFADAHVTREDLERLINQPLRRAVALASDTINQAGLSPRDLSGVFLVGGSSRIPLVARLVQEQAGVLPTTLDQPETVVARGALRTVTVDPVRTGGLPIGLVQGAVQGARPGSSPMTAPSGSPTRVPVGQPGPGTRPWAPGRFAGPFAPAAALGPSHGAPQPAAPLGMPPGLPPRQQPTSSTAGPASVEPTQPMTRPMAASSTGVTLGSRLLRGRLPWVIGAVVAVVAVVAGLVIFVIKPGSSPGQGDASSPPAAFTTTAAPPSATIAQYEYRFAVPDGWSQSGSDNAQMGVQVTPDNAPSTSNVIYVGEYRLSYDAVANRDRFISQLQPQVRQSGYQRFISNGTYAGRNVIYYQDTRNSSFTVDWYVLLQGNVQVSVGCQYPTGGQSNIDAACQQVVRSMALTNWK